MIVTDCYSSYQYLPEANHQVCWAHLKRDFQRISEREGKAGAIGKRLLQAYKKLFVFWKTEFDSALSLSKKQRRRLRYLKNKLSKGLMAGSSCGHEKTQNTCKNILSEQSSLWRFFEVEGVPPTNNPAERQLRPLVIDKKLSFGTQSERGSRYLERLFTVITRCKQQGRDTLSFILEALQKYFLASSPPSLSAVAATP